MLSEVFIQRGNNVRFLLKCGIYGRVGFKIYYVYDIELFQ